MDNSTKSKLNNALLKKALGFNEMEVTEEYALVDGEWVLQKKKVNTKTYPPDLSALQIMLSKTENKNISKYKQMSLEDLQIEKQKLIKKLEGEQNED